MHTPAMPSFSSLLRALALLALASGCASPPSEAAKAPPPPPLPNVRNPTGDCASPPDNGARPGHAPGQARYLPDCKAPLRRQYFRVFAQSESNAYMIPRPDNVPTTRALCTSEPAGSPLRALLEKYTLCTEAPDVERVNAMTAADALAIAHALHEHMQFVANGGDVRPFPYDDDVLAVCDAKHALALSDRCMYTRELERKMREQGELAEPYRIPPDAEGPPLAAALNELYGISVK